MSDHLATHLAAFLAEHRRCGELDTGLIVTPPRVWLTCSCGARMERPADDSTKPEKGEGLMVCAIYARKSTDQNIADEEKSVARQVARLAPTPSARAGRSTRPTSTLTTGSREPISCVGMATFGS